MFRYFDRLQPLGLLALRLVLGAILFVHGKPKVFGGMPHMIDLVHSIGFPAVFAYLASYTEFLGGILLIAGLLTRCVSIAIVIEMTVIITKVLWHNGFTGMQNNYQFPLALGAMAFALIWFGAGPISLDRLFGGKR